MISHKQSQSYILSMIFVLALGFGLRLFRLTANSLWLDEAYSFFLSQLSIEQIVRGTMVDQHPPLYYIFLHFWMMLGQDVFTLRFLSVMVGVISIAWCFRLSRQLFASQVGLMSSILLCISPIHIWYSQEVRMYVFLTLFSMISIYLFWLTINNAQKWLIWAGLVLINLLALYTHNLAIFIIIFENLIWIGLLLVKKSNLPKQKWILVQAIILLGYAPWIPVVLLQTTQHPMKWIPHPTPELMANILARITFGGQWTGSLKNYLELGLTVFLSGIAVIHTIQPRKKHRLQTVLVLLWFIIPFGIITLISYKVSLFQDKQFLFLTPAMVLIFAISLAEQKTIWLKIITAIVIVSLIWLPLYKQYSLPQKTDWRLIAQFIEDHLQPGDIIYMNAASSALPLNYYITRRDVPQDGYPNIFDFETGGWHGQVATQSIVKSEMRRLVKNHNRVWFIDFGSGFWDPKALIPAWLNQHCVLLGNETVSAVKISLYETSECAY